MKDKQRIKELEKELEACYNTTDIHKKVLQKYKELEDKLAKYIEYHEGDGRCKKCGAVLMPPSCANCDFDTRLT